MKKGMEEQRRNQEAESAYVRKKLWGEEGEKGGEVDEEMGDNIYLGDIRMDLRDGEQQPQSQPATSSIGKTLAAAGLAAAGLGAGVALPILAYNMTRPQTPSVVVEQPAITDTDTDTQYGLQIYRDEQE